MSERFDYFLPCPKGVEPMLADELRRIGVRGVRPQRSGAIFAGSVADGLRALMWTRLASRVLLKIAEVHAVTADALYESVASLPWEDHMGADGTLAVDATGVNDSLRNTQFTAVRVKDGIADRFRERSGRRPSVDTRAPDLRVNVAVRGDRATISLDLAGEPLHRRGYREPGVQVAAPMKETLAAAVLDWAGWREVAEEGGALVDPMCGSGTIAIEGAMMAGDIAPGLLRGSVPASRWAGFEREAWEALVEEAQERRDAGLERLPLITAADIDPRAVEIARGCARRAGLEFYIDIEQRALSQLEPPSDTAPGLIATNPPWGERLSDRAELTDLYQTFAQRLGSGFNGWGCAVVSPDPALRAALGLPAVRTAVLGSGKGVATVTLFEVQAVETAPVPDGAEEFANRLDKMAKHLGKWARRTGVTCYRIYDADLPDFAVAVDLYQGAGRDEGRRWAHVAEYAPPKDIDEAKSSQRLQAAVAVTAHVLGVPAANVFLKRRERQRGAAQYERVADRSETATVSEGGLLFEVNLSDYLDTGLFLDHRDTRAWIRELAEGTRFLNLFAYTGSATVYAAAGGAVSTMTTDLSQTYLDWAERNMALNGFTAPEHQRLQRDASEFVVRALKRRDEYDLIFCDPPTFSNSKRMDRTFDVQRDHGALLASLSGILAEKGTIVFSCNRRSFVLDEQALAAAGLAARDVTARTIPKDFERRPNIHRCWSITRG